MSQLTMSPKQVVRATQIITAALIAGVVVFAAIGVFATGALAGPPRSVIVSTLACAYAAVAFVLHLFIPPIIARKRSGEATAEQLYIIHQQKTIIGLAILEGAAFFCVIALMVEYHWWSLAAAVGLVLWMLALFPTQTRVEHWIETQQMLNGPSD